MSGFRVPACAICGRPTWPPQLACARCGAAEWTEVDASAGTVVEITDAPGADGTPIRLGTIELAVPYPAYADIGDGGRGPFVVARCEGCAVEDEVRLELLEGVLRARPVIVSK
jgi:uncharacterized OB-fold protein